MVTSDHQLIRSKPVLSGEISEVATVSDPAPRLVGIRRTRHLYLYLMSWKTSKFVSSLMGLFVEPAQPVSAERRIGEVRQAMLDCLVGIEESHRVTRLWARVLYAPDVQALWYLRADLMTLVAESRGESEAQEQLSTISAKFKGLLPSAQKARPNRFGS